MEAGEVGLAKVGIRRVYVMDEAKRRSVSRNSFWRRPPYSSTRGKEPTCHCRRQQEMWVHSLGRDNPSEQEMATHSSISWKIPWTEEAGGLQSMGFHKVRWLSTHAESHSREGPTGAHWNLGESLPQSPWCLGKIRRCIVLISALIFFPHPGLLRLNSCGTLHSCQSPAHGFSFDTGYNPVSRSPMPQLKSWNAATKDPKCCNKDPTKQNKYF